MEYYNIQMWTEFDSTYLKLFKRSHNCIKSVFTSSTFCSIHSGNLSSRRKMRVWSRLWPSRSWTWSGLTPRLDLHLLHLRSWLEAASAMIFKVNKTILQQKANNNLLKSNNLTSKTVEDDEKAADFLLSNVLFFLFSFSSMFKWP